MSRLLRRRKILSSSELPITPADLRLFLETDATGLTDAQATEWISVALDNIEKAYNVAFLAQRWKAVLSGGRRQQAALDGSRDAPLMLYPVPISPINFKVKALQSGILVDVTDLFELSCTAHPAEIALKAGKSLVLDDALEALQITYEAGADRVEDVPPAMIMGLKALSGFLVENTSAGVELANGITRFSIDSISVAFGAQVSRFDLLQSARGHLDQFSTNTGLGVPT